MCDPMTSMAKMRTWQREKNIATGNLRRKEREADREKSGGRNAYDSPSNWRNENTEQYREAPYSGQHYESGYIGDKNPTKGTMQGKDKGKKKGEGKWGRGEPRGRQKELRPISRLRRPYSKNAKPARNMQTERRPMDNNGCNYGLV